MALATAVVKKAKSTSHRICLRIFGVLVSFLINYSISFSTKSAILEGESLPVEEDPSSLLIFGRDTLGIS